MNEEPVLLHEQDLMLAMLQAAAAAPASLDDALSRLERFRRQANEPPVPDRDEIETRLRQVASALRSARALECSDDGTLRITESGRELLRRHPDGIDTSVLMELEPYRTAMELKAGPPDADLRSSDPRPGAYDDGQRAFSCGRRFAQNPFASDSVDHLAWQNGWTEARDESLLGPDHRPGLPERPRRTRP
jgi:hypothetical protein